MTWPGRRCASNMAPKELPDLNRPINGVEPWGILLTYRDGTKAFGAPARLLQRHALETLRANWPGERLPRATSHYVGPWRNRCLFMALSNAIQQFFVTARSPVSD